MKLPEIRPVILAGGVGTRLWPLSREAYPKQLLHFAGGKHTLLQATALRLEGLERHAAGGGGVGTTIGAPVVVCHEDHRFFVLDQLQSIGRDPERVLLEPASRNTAPALTVAALAAVQDNADPALLVMPADHVIEQSERFRDAVLTALALAGAGSVVTFGIVPVRAEAGYGYIRRGAPLAADGSSQAFTIREFVEKPDRGAAAAYVKAGDYFWNSGLFMMRASVWLHAIERYRPDIAAACRQAFERGRADGVFYRVDKTVFADCAAESIDYAVMEGLGSSQTANPKGGASAAVVALDTGWSDVGSWPALLELGDRDDRGNVRRGDVYEQDTRGSLLISEHRFVAGVGLKDTIVVETPDAVLVASKDHCQDTRRVVEWLNRHGREEGRTHRKVYRPWGNYERLDAGERFQVKRLTIKPGASISLQLHHHRAEHWVVVRGTAKVTRGEEQFLLTENESTFIPLGTRHRLENPGHVPLEVIEVQSGTYLGEDDIIRFEDRYDRESGE